MLQIIKELSIALLIILIAAYIIRGGKIFSSPVSSGSNIDYKVEPYDPALYQY